MTEARIRKAAYRILEKEGFHGWSAPKVRYRETDIFGIFDGLFVRDSELRFIQWTTASNMSARKRKIMSFFDEHSCFIPCEVWGMREDGTFRKIQI